MSSDRKLFMSHEDLEKQQEQELQMQQQQQTAQQEEENNNNSVLRFFQNFGSSNNLPIPSQQQQQVHQPPGIFSFLANKSSNSPTISPSTSTNNVNNLTSSSSSINNLQSSSIGNFMNNKLNSVVPIHSGLNLYGKNINVNSKKSLNSKFEAESQIVTVIQSSRASNNQLGNLISLNKYFISYVVKGEKVRILDRSSSTRILLKDFPDVIDIQFHSENVNILSCCSQSDGCIYIYEILNNGESINAKLLTKIKQQQIGTPSYYTTVKWHPTKTDTLLTCTNDSKLVYAFNINQPDVPLFILDSECGVPTGICWFEQQDTPKKSSILVANGNICIFNQDNQLENTFNGVNGSNGGSGEFLFVNHISYDSFIAVTKQSEIYLLNRQFNIIQKISFSSNLFSNCSLLSIKDSFLFISDSNSSKAYIIHINSGKKELDEDDEDNYNNNLMAASAAVEDGYPHFDFINECDFKKPIISFCFQSATPLLKQSNSTSSLSSSTQSQQLQQQDKSLFSACSIQSNSVSLHSITLDSYYSENDQYTVNSLENDVVEQSGLYLDGLNKESGNNCNNNNNNGGLLNDMISPTSSTNATVGSEDDENKIILLTPKSFTQPSSPPPLSLPEPDLTCSSPNNIHDETGGVTNTSSTIVKPKKDISAIKNLKKKVKSKDVVSPGGIATNVNDSFIPIPTTSTTTTTTTTSSSNGSTPNTISPTSASPLVANSCASDENNSGSTSPAGIKKVKPKVSSKVPTSASNEALNLLEIKEKEKDKSPTVTTTTSSTTPTKVVKPVIATTTITTPTSTTPTKSKNVTPSFVAPQLIIPLTNPASKLVTVKQPSSTSLTNTTPPTVTAVVTTTTSTTTPSSPPQNSTIITPPPSITTTTTTTSRASPTLFISPPVVIEQPPQPELPIISPSPIQQQVYSTPIPASTSNYSSTNNIQQLFMEMENNLFNRLEKTMSNQFAQNERERIERETMEKERHEKLLAVVHQSITTMMKNNLEKIVKKEIANTFLNLEKTLPTTVEASIAKVTQEQIKKLTVKTDALLKTSSDSIVSSVKQLIISDTFEGMVKNQMENIFISYFQTILIPGFEKSCQSMFKHLSYTFENGFNQSIQHQTLTSQGQHLALEKILNDSNSLIKQCTTQLIDQQDQLLKEFKKPQQPQQQQYSPTLNQQPQQFQQMMNQQPPQQPPHSPISGFYPFPPPIQQAQQPIQQEPTQQEPIQQQPEQPLQLTPQQQQQLINIKLAGYPQLKALAETNHIDAFNFALNASNLQMVVGLCACLDPYVVFSTNKFPQTIILSLIQQLSINLGTDTELKLKWIKECLFVVDNSKMNVTKKILGLLKTKLDDPQLSTLNSHLLQSIKYMIKDI